MGFRCLAHKRGINLRIGRWPGASVYIIFTLATAISNGIFMRPPRSSCLSLREPPMLDIVFLALTCVLFLIGAGYAVLCDRL